MKDQNWEITREGKLLISVIKKEVKSEIEITLTQEQVIIISHFLQHHLNKIIEQNNPQKINN